MQGVLAAEFTEFLLFKLFRRRFLVDKRDVIAAFALCALKSDNFDSLFFRSHTQSFKCAKDKSALPKSPRTESNR